MMPNEKNTKRVILALDQAYEKFIQLENKSTDEAEIVSYRCLYTNIYESKLYVEQMQKEIDSLNKRLNRKSKWIPVSEGLPEEHDTIFAKLKGTDKWRSAMFEKMSDDVRIVVVFPDGTRRVSHSHTVDGKWECEKSPVTRTVTHWMPNPAMPKAGEQE